jgi:hypothetical protein
MKSKKLFQAIGLISDNTVAEYDEFSSSGVVIRPRSKKRLISIIIAATITLTLLTIVGFAYGSRIIELLGGGRIESGKTSDGDDYISISTNFKSNPVEVKDGRVYFVLDNSNTDITSYCTESTFFMYEQVGDNGYRHVIIVGGTPDRLGWGEFIWDDKGNAVGSNATFYEDADGEHPEWLKRAEESLQN